MPRLLPLLLILTPACRPGTEFDQGDICVDPGVVAEFAAGDAITFEVVFQECISACARDVETACDVRVEGDTIWLDASGSYKESAQRTCVALCAELSAECEVPDLAPGTYTVRSGDHELVVTLPSAEAPELASTCHFFGP